MGFSTKALISAVLIVLALGVEYAVSSGGVLRWVMWVLAEAPAEAPVAEATPAIQQITPPRPPSPPTAAPKAALAASPKRPAAEIGVNLLADSSFETGPGPEDAGWSFDATGGDALGARTQDASKQGDYSLGMEASESANRGWPGWHSLGRFPLAPGRAYALRAHALSPDGASAWLTLYLFDEAGTWLGNRSTGCRPDFPRPSVWGPLELRLRIDDDPRIAQVELGLQQCLSYSKGRATRLFYDEVFFGAVAD